MVGKTRFLVLITPFFVPPPRKMCGIGICCTADCNIEQVVNVDLLNHRGPDIQNTQACLLTEHISATEIIGCTLHLRGPSPVKQPMEAADGSKLLWNGEIFSAQVSTNKNDTTVLMELLGKCADTKDLLSTFSQLHGPWAFIYWQAKTKKLWFGRDMFGRRSLLCKCVQSPQFIFALSSVACRPHADHNTDRNTENWFEVPAHGIYCWDLSKECHFVPLLYPWSFFDCVKQSASALDGMTENRDPFTNISVQSDRIQAPVSEEFNSRLPSPSDLEFYTDALKWASDREGSLVENIFQATETPAFRDIVESFERTLKSAVDTRVRSCPDQCCLCIQRMVAKNDFQTGICSLADIGSTPCEHSKIAVLFSGGLDSTVLALLVHRCLPAPETIDLLNVAFEQKTSTSFDVPDRLSGRQSFAELQLLAPNRKWNFVEIEVSKAEMEKESEKWVSDLVYPLTTVLDNDIGCAVWFAARGRGMIYVDGKRQPYTSSARVVLTGMGADEQLAGYARHRVCFKRDGWAGLISELKMEMNRIASRNLGRDDRVISDHGREARFPFLDENVVSFLNLLPVWYKTLLDLPRGIGDKFLLRWVAQRMQLTTATYLAKRAIQFGSRIAKIDKNRKGTDTCENLRTKLLSQKIEN